MSYWTEEVKDGRRTLTFEARVEYQAVAESKVILPDVYDEMEVRYKPVRVTLEVLREEHVDEWPVIPSPTPVEQNTEKDG